MIRGLHKPVAGGASGLADAGSWSAGWRGVAAVAGFALATGFGALHMARRARPSRPALEVPPALARALEGARITLFCQDRDLVYSFVHNGTFYPGAAGVVGQDDAALIPPDQLAMVRAVKRRVLATARGEALDVHHGGPADVRSFRVQVDPYVERGSVVGLVCTAVDVTEDRAARQAMLSLSDALSGTVQRFEIALRGADVIVFVQDLDLTYAWVSGPFGGHRPETLLGQGDHALFSRGAVRRLTDMKTSVLASGEAGQMEVRSKATDGERWYLVRVEPQRDRGGLVTGLLGTAVDITERRSREMHIRILLRELTHRTKNLLAVVQAMSRQTLVASHSASDFEQRFSGRLQALASALDVLVDENWEGAPLRQVIRAQLGPYCDRGDDVIRLRGPAVHCEPEAAQNLGLALHELSTNSSRYGALSVEGGRVTISWGFEPTAEGMPHFVMRWMEEGGPSVERPARGGFGQSVIERLVPRALEGEARLDFSPDGIAWTLDVPVRLVRPADGWAGRLSSRASLVREGG